MERRSTEEFQQRLGEIASSTGLDNNTGLFALDSDFRKLAVSYSTFFGAMRALLLQIAHPVVAQGVHDHSAYDTDPTGRAIRTFLAVFAITLGRQQFAKDIAERVFEAHIPIKGVIPAYRPGMEDRIYSAMQPEANLWVWATLVEGIVFGHEEVRDSVDRQRLEHMYEESKIFAEYFNVIPEMIPATLDEFEAYFQDVVDNRLEVTPAGQKVADAILGGAKFPYTLGSWLIRSLAVESLPDNVRRDFGWDRTRFTKTVYGSLQAAGRLGYAVLPEFLKPTPMTWYPGIRRKLLGPGE